MSHELHGIAIARVALLSAGLLFGAASAASAANGYFDTAGALLVAPSSQHNVGDSASTIARQRQSGYFADAAEPLVAPVAQNSTDSGLTRRLQQASGYFSDAGAPLVTPNLDQR